jgi:hypothetical protein
VRLRNKWEHRKGAQLRSGKQRIMKRIWRSVMEEEGHSPVLPAFNAQKSKRRSGDWLTEINSLSAKAGPWVERP